MTLHDIGTTITYKNIKHTIIGYSKDLWYQIRPVDSTSHHYNIVSGKHFSNIIPKKTLKVATAGSTSVFTNTLRETKTITIDEQSISTTSVGAGNVITEIQTSPSLTSKGKNKIYIIIGAILIGIHILKKYV